MRSRSVPPATFDDFWEVWRELLHAERAPGTGFLVEGERDRRALRRLGVRAPVLLVHRGRALARVAAEVGRELRAVIVLTDWDPKGGELARRLRELLDDGRTAVDVAFRRRLGIALRGEVVHLEGLGSWARRRAEQGAFPLEEWVGDPDGAA
jgi:5S rRNA maturation endonuclease (ribonuclease M5)